ncbi:hypothetical protein ANCCAN_12955 [Ancylostoma caninum]|uniref:SCP domain-containing protein n=1 Tax=Ancylostoma caninum TaxID=29170 RepID=A0A368G9P1_ANCCA|nr:hypothetical protein ANCCAN_12955 [Ancylostoma caninum]
MQWPLVLLFATAIVAENTSPEEYAYCAMAQHYRKKIEAFHKERRGEDDTMQYDCLLEVRARRKQENDSYELPSDYGVMKIKLARDNGKSTDQNLIDAFNSIKGKNLRQMKNKKVTRYGCWGLFYPAIYKQLSVLCLYDYKVE